MSTVDQDFAARALRKEIDQWKQAAEAEIEKLKRYRANPDMWFWREPIGTAWVRPSSGFFATAADIVEELGSKLDSSPITKLCAILRRFYDDQNEKHVPSEADLQRMLVNVRYLCENLGQIVYPTSEEPSATDSKPDVTATLIMPGPKDEVRSSMANGEPPLSSGEAVDAKTDEEQDSPTRPKRPMYKRDHQLLDWHDDPKSSDTYNSDAGCRNKWDAEHPEQQIPGDTKTASLGNVKKAIALARKERSEEHKSMGGN